MALANYTDLLAAVAAFSHRTDLTSIIPDLVTLAEIRINGDLDARAQDAKTTLTTVIDTESVALPSDLIGMRHLSVSSTTPKVTLDYVTPDNLYNTYAYGDSGTPRVYTVVGDTILLAPLPDAAYTLTIIYKAKVPNLAAAGTTWLMTRYPHIYLYGTLLEVAVYTKEQDRLTEYTAMYKTAIETATAQDWFPGSTMRVRSDVAH